MKKHMLIIAALCGALLLAGCSGKEAPKGTVEKAEKTEKTEKTGEAASEDAAAEEDVDAGFDTGDVSGSLYKNEFFGLQWEIPDNYVVMSEEEIAQMTAQVQDAFSDVDAIKDALESGSSYYDLYVVQDDGYSQLNIVLGKLSLAEMALAMGGNTEKLVDMMVEQMPDMLKGTQMEDAEITRGDVKFLGSERPCIVWYFEQEIPGDVIECYQKQVLVVKGSYSMTITATSYVEDKTEEMLKAFTEVY